MNEYNSINPTILMKHIEKAYIESLEIEYRHRGYNVYKNKEFESGVITDLAVEKEGRWTVFEIKTGKYKAEKKKQSEKLKEYINRNVGRMEFKLVFLNPPEYKEIQFDGLKEIILSDMIDNELPNELDELSTHTRIENITDIEISEINIEDPNIHIVGKANIEVSLQYGSDSDSDEDGSDEIFECFPLKFDIHLKMDYSMDESEYEIDTSEFFE